MNHLAIVLKGMVVGLANVIPGVSGGTLLFTLGLYERMTEALGNLFSDSSEHAAFLAALGAGVASGILVFASLIRFLLAGAATRQPTFFFFAGLILGSLPFLLRSQPDLRPRPARLLTALAGVALVLAASLIGGGAEAEARPEVLWSLGGLVRITALDPLYGLKLAACGFLATAAMIVPGFSGSALLVSLGEYANMLYFVDERMITPIAAFGLGALPGLVVFARVIHYCLRRWPATTYYLIFGLVGGSFYQIGLELAPGFSLAPLQAAASLAALAVGFVLAFLTSPRQKPDPAREPLQRRATLR